MSDITLKDKICFCGLMTKDRRWTCDGFSVVCNDCQLGGKNDTWIRECYGCGTEDPKQTKSTWKWIGENPDACDWICPECEKLEPVVIT